MAARRTTTKKQETSLADKFIPVLVGISVLLAFTVGILWQKVSDLEKGGVRVAGNAAGNIAGTGGEVPPAAPPGPQAGKLSEDQAADVAPVTGEDHLRGNRNAKVTIVEYSDLECPFCGRFHETAQQAVNDYNGDVNWVYRHFPLDSIHPQARPAAAAAECAAELAGNDGFWNFIDAVFTDQTKISSLSSVAGSVGINTGAFDNCVSSDKYADKVEAQYQTGLAAGVTGTPGNFVINDKGEIWLVPGAVPLDQLKTTIDEALSS